MLFPTRHLAWHWGDLPVQVARFSRLFQLVCVFAQVKTIAIVTFVLLLHSNKATGTDDDVLKLTTGAEYITGNFGGTESIDELYVPLTLRYTRDNKYAFRLTVPYIRVTGPAGTIQADGTLLPDNGRRITETGLGDVIASMTYRDALNVKATSDLAMDLTAKLKFGTADENKGLGSGETDYSLQAELYKYYDHFMSFGILGYKFRGDTPTLDYNDSWFTLVGGDYRFSTSLSAGLDYYFQQALFAGTDNQMEMSAFIHYKLGDTHFLRSYLIKGFGDTSPDWGVGVILTFTQ